ncbi:hypothetical protein Bpfe_008019 [Biomphalaria pfeifferi]|uniref:Uncharacterized protein n=1 Tax=Biomphalaria pfeifferi TaxID=112525 RepID=A0AAD8BY91_BIOPF|nr:hypothetical protein Bpfe_008019 [Biomphalaria pfeifferi]
MDKLMRAVEGYIRPLRERSPTLFINPLLLIQDCGCTDSYKECVDLNKKCTEEQKETVEALEEVCYATEAFAVPAMSTATTRTD